MFVFSEHTAENQFNETILSDGFGKTHRKDLFDYKFNGAYSDLLFCDSGGIAKAIFSNPLHPYTKELFSAIPNPNPDVKMNRIVLNGDIPSPANPPKGCRFHTRCPNATEKCKYVTPTYKECEDGHFAACHLLDKESNSE